jgi:hypothetical protein
MLPLNNTKEEEQEEDSTTARAGKRKEEKPTQKHDNSIVPGAPLFSSALKPKTFVQILVRLSDAAAIRGSRSWQTKGTDSIIY